MVISELQTKIQELQQRELANCQQIDQLMKENLELIQQAAKAKAYKKQIDILLADPTLVKIRMSQDKDNSIEIETDSVVEERNKVLIEKIKEISSERDKYAQIAAEQSYYQEQIDEKNKRIVELSEKLSMVSSNAEILEKQLEATKESMANGEFNTDDASQSDKIKIVSLEENNKHLNEILKQKVEEVGSLTAINTELTMKNQELMKQVSEAQMMVSLQQTENRIITDPLLDKSAIAQRIQQACERVFENAERETNKLNKRIKDLEVKIKNVKPIVQTGSSEKEKELQEMVDDLTEQVQYLEENDAAPQLASALAKINELQSQINWLKNKE